MFPGVSSLVGLSFIYSGVPQGKGAAAPPRQIQQRSDASHHCPAALVPCFSVKDALPAKERCHNAYTGTIYARKYCKKGLGCCR